MNSNLPRVVAPGEVVVGEPREIVGALHGQPAHVVRLELLDQLTAHVDEAGAPRRQEPLLRAAREDVDVRRRADRASAGQAPESRRRRRYTPRSRHSAPSASRSTRAPDANWTHETVTTRTRSSSSSRAQAVDVEHALVARQTPILDAAPFGELPSTDRRSPETRGRATARRRRPSAAARTPRG